MKKLFCFLSVGLMIIFVSGCKKNDEQIGEFEGYTACSTEEKENTLCNYMYSPVCGDDGQTYGNACIACSSQKINLYKEGECNCNDEEGVCIVPNENNVNESNIDEKNDTPEVTIEVPMPNF